MGRFRVPPFIDLFPARLDQLLVGRRIRSARLQKRRRDLFLRKHPRKLPRTGDRPRLYVDLAVISRSDAGTGIQRVVRALALALAANPAGLWDVCFVTAFRRTSYHVISWPNSASSNSATPLSARPGDVFLGLDFSLDAVRRHRRQLAQFKRDGGSLWFLIYDLLPIQRPDWFSPNNVIRFKAWLEVLAAVADGFFCISQQTEQDLEHTLYERFGLRDGYRTAVVPMGHDIMGSVTRRSVDQEKQPVRFDTSLPFILMVGTLEPRKGHADVLAAFTHLWLAGSNERLVLVGRMGWRVDLVRSRIVSHPELGHKLLWFDDVDDWELERIYQACQGVIVASHAEGFGLPLIEALGHKKPVLARDLTVFRQHRDRGVQYFPPDAAPGQLAACIRDWVKRVRGGEIIVTPPNTGWKRSASVMLAALEGT